MQPSSCVSLLALLAAVTHGEVSNSTDLIVATERALLKVSAEGSTRIVVYQKTTVVSGYGTVPLAVDSKNSRVFYSLPQLSDDGDRFTEIFYVNVQPNPQPVKLLFPGTLPGHIRGLAYDQQSGILYWTNMIGHSIWKCTVAGGCEDAQRLKLLPEGKEPAGIAVDPCRGYLYWTDNNHTSPSVNKMRINGKQWSTIISDGIFMPNGIAVDPSGPGRIYWTDDSEGNAYKIESANLRGGDRVTEHRGYHQMPMDLAYSPASADRSTAALHWSDWTGHAAWTLNLTRAPGRPSRLPLGGGAIPMGVVTVDSLKQDAQCPGSGGGSRND